MRRKICANIGDTPLDMQVGVLTIGRTGTKTREELLAAGATQVIDDFFSLPTLFDSERIILSERIYEGGGE